MYIPQNRYNDFELSEQLRRVEEQEDIIRAEQEELEEERAHLHATRGYNYCDCYDCCTDQVEE